MEAITKWIVVGEGNRPMSFDGEQFCYVGAVGPTTRGKHSRFPLRSYTRSEIRSMIKKHNKYRVYRGWLKGDLRLMPVKWD